MLKSFFAPEVLTIFPYFFGYREKILDKKVIVNFKIYGVTDQYKYCHINKKLPVTLEWAFKQLTANQTSLFQPF